MEIKTIKSGDCIEVVSHKTHDGYPRYCRNGVTDFAHRHSYRKHHGDIPSDKCVRHTCDNRRCINPNHLILGTWQENIRDRDRRKRTAIGEKNGRSKLLEGQVLEILNDDKTPKMHLAERFNVDPKVIRDIKNGVTWTHVTGL